MTEEVLEQKIDNLTENINGLKFSMRADDETYKAILSKIARRLDELETEENLDIVEIKDRIKFMSSQLDDGDLTPQISELAQIIADLKNSFNISFEQISEDLEDSKNFNNNSLQRFSELVEKMEQIHNDGNEKNTQLFEEVKELQSQNNENTNDFVKKLEEQNNNFNSKNEIIIQKITQIQEECESKNIEAIEKIEQLHHQNNDRTGEIFNEIKEDLNQLRQSYETLGALPDKVKEGIAEALNNIESKFNEISNAQNTAQENYENIMNSSLGTLRNQIESLSQDLRTLISETENRLNGCVYEIVENNENNFKEFKNVQNSTSDELKDAISFNIDDVKGQILDSENNIKESIRAHIDDYKNETQVSDKLEFLMDSVSLINKDTADLIGELESLKYTAQNTNDNSTPILYGVNELKNTTYSINEGVINISGEVSNLTGDVSQLANEISQIKNITLDTQSNSPDKEDLKNNLRELQEQFVLQMLQLFDNVSFEQETEEIIDFVSGENYEIKNELETLQKEIDKLSNKDDSEFFNEHFNNLCDLVTKNSSNEFDLLKEVASEIKKITANSENEEEYSYSLPDVESDLAKIRLILKELQTSKTIKDEQEIDFNERFEVLNEDISSISKRTNKLILTSEDTNKKFKSYLDEFKGIMDRFAQKNRQSYIEQKLDSVTRLVMSNAKSAQILNEAFMHFAMWIDDTSEAMTSNRTLMEDTDKKVAEALVEFENVKASAKENINTISSNFGKTQEEFKTLKEKFDNLEEKFEKLNEKFDTKVIENKELQMTIEKQNKLISKLEDKVDKYGKVEVNLDDETKSMIEYIAAQANSTAENTKDNKNLNSKLEFLEHKISTLSKSIQKIISYIDEE